MSNTELIDLSEVLALDGLRTNAHTAELLGWAVTSLVGSVLSVNGDLDTLTVKIFPDLEDNVECLRINVTANVLEQE